MHVFTFFNFDALMDNTMWILQLNAYISGITLFFISSKHIVFCDLSVWIIYITRSLWVLDFCSMLVVWAAHHQPERSPVNKKVRVNHRLATINTTCTIKGDKSLMYGCCESACFLTYTVQFTLNYMLWPCYNTWQI